MSILRTDKIAGLDSVNAITGSVFFGNGDAATAYDSLVTDASSDYTMGTGDFNLEGWFYLNSVATTWQILISDTLYGDTGGWSFYANGAQLNFWKGGASVVSGGTLTANTWHHIAFSREGGTNRIFVDGVVAGTATDSTDYTDNRISVGANNVDKGGILGSYGLNGYASNVRVCKGHAVYDKAFTPPTRELLQHYTSPGNESVLLCCQSSQDAGQDATGRTLSVRGNARPTTFVPDVGNDHTHGTVLEGGTAFTSLNYMTLPRGTTTQANRGRAVLAGSNPASNIMSYLSIQSSGNSIDFGDLITASDGLRGGSSSTRGLFAHSAASSPYTNTIEYVTIATTANALNFGDMTGTSSSGATGTNDTRAVFWEGTVPSSGVTICYATIASLGDAADFGDMSIGVRHIDSMNSSTRCVIPGGWQTSPDINTNVIQYITFATLGDAQDFGDVALSGGIRASGAFSSPTRGVYGGGANSPSNTILDTIEYITLASTGNAVDFGNLTQARRVEGGGTSSHTRGIFAGGYTPTQVNTIDTIQIATTGNATDFGDSTGFRCGALSDCHGGLT